MVSDGTDGDHNRGRKISFKNMVAIVKLPVGPKNGDTVLRGRKETFE